ncbi:MAG: RDD family protein [Parcubacteria group bacterium]|jgi:uncharacterized RDD family membrane protein YckC
MNQQIVAYLQTNKGQYTQESLVAQLRGAGHNENDIADAVNAVYGGVSASPVPGVQTVKYAGFWIRFVAVIVDSIIVSIAGGIIGFILGFILAAVAGTGSDSLFGGMLSSLIGLLITWTYFIFMTHNFQATLGKKLLGLEVRASDASSKATLGSIILRETIGKLLSMIFYIGYIMAGFTAKKQGLHDMIAKTVVVYKDPQKKSSTAIIVTIILLVVFMTIAIVGIIASVMFVSLNSARDKASGSNYESINEMPGNGYESTTDPVGDVGTYADAILTQDTMQGVVAKLSILGCDQYESYEPHILTDVAYTGNDVRSWEERWVVSGCGSEYPIDITFTETRGEGTVWTIK